MVAGNDRNAYAAKHRDMLEACPRGSDSHIRELHSMPDIDVCKRFVSSSALFVVHRLRPARTGLVLLALTGSVAARTKAPIASQYNCLWGRLA